MRKGQLLAFLGQTTNDRNGGRLRSGSFQASVNFVLGGEGYNTWLDTACADARLVMVGG
jgi:hypothetical protein